MRASRLKLEGFIGIASGRGKPSIEINFNALSPDSKIVAIKGPNGAGKTTLMDNMHPYRVMPSRASTPTPSSFSFYDHLVEGVDGLKELEWEHDGRGFKSVIRMKAAGKTKKQEAYLFEMKGADLAPYQDATGLTSDGKADTYDRAVEAVLGKPEVFFTTQFSAQGKSPISTMTAGEIKTLMASMLAMENVKALADKASDVVRGLKPHLSAAQALVVPLEQTISLAAPMLEKADGIKADIEAAGAKIVQAKSYARQKLTALSSLEARAGQQEQLGVQREAAAMQIASATEEHRKQLLELEARLNVEVNQVNERFTQNQSSLRVAKTAHDNAVLRVSDAKSLAGRASEIGAAEAKKRVLQQAISELRARADDLHVSAEKLAGLQNVLSDLKATLAAELVDGKALAALIEALKATSALMGEVPCSGHAFASSCSLLAQANEAMNAIPVRQQKLVDMRGSYGVKKVSFENQSLDLAKLMKDDADLRELQNQIGQKESQLNDFKALLADAPSIEKAKTELPGLVMAQQQAEADYDTAATRLAASNDAKSQLLASQQRQTGDLQGLQAKEVTRLETALAQLPDMVQTVDVDHAKKALLAADQAVVEAESKRDELQAQLRESGNARAALENAKEQLIKVNRSTDAISQEIAQWTLLARALGNDGIIAMSIDDAGPSISALCNALLNDCYGGRFVVRISTQEATATGVLKEAFVIHVEDTLRGEQKELEQMSGGEKVWINECLIRAMALYVAQSTGAKFKTLFGDESDGPLDSERKRQFMAMKRAVLERGGYDREYIITQTPELWELCDEVIDVTTL